MQDENRELDKQKNVLIAAGLVDPVGETTREEIAKLFEEKVKEVKTEDGKHLYEIVEDGKLEMAVLPVEGKGLWSTTHCPTIVGSS